MIDISIPTSYQFGEDSSTSSMTSLNLDLHLNQSDLSHSVLSSPVAHSVVLLWDMESEAYRVSKHTDLCPFIQGHN